MIDDDLIYRIIRQRIRTLREKHPRTQKRTTQANLSVALGIERSTLTNIELGNQRPPIHVLYRLCDYFGITLDELLPSLSLISDKSSNKPSTVVVGPDEHELPNKTLALVDRIRASRS